MQTKAKMDRVNQQNHSLLTSPNYDILSLCNKNLFLFSPELINYSIRLSNYLYVKFQVNFLKNKRVIKTLKP